MNYQHPDFYAAWAQGGRRAYCYLRTAREWAMSSRDYVTAAELDFLEDVLNVKTVLEVEARDPRAFAA